MSETYRQTDRKIQDKGRERDCVSDIILNLHVSVFCFVVSVGEGLVSKPKSKMPKTGDSNAQGRQVSSLLSLAYYHLLQINY